MKKIKIKENQVLQRKFNTYLRLIISRPGGYFHQISHTRMILIELGYGIELYIAQKNNFAF